VNTPRNRIPFVYIIFLGIIIIMFVFQLQETPQIEELTINQLAADIKAEKVKRIEVEDDDQIYVLYNDGTEKETLKESQSDPHH